MSERVWMQVSSSCHQGLDDQRIEIYYSTAVDMVLITVGTGEMYIPVAMAAAMVGDFVSAVEAALRAQVSAPADGQVA
ncbi:hypothetical protein [Nocardia sp. NPDC056000]|uniref:hypothetical protein n=1 Tax=Nocardia sp. NPDC056000 TaxID=3345674 RepID=UPI0035DBE486